MKHISYETVIGLEVHVELATESKLFCSCSAKFGAEPNENVCPACCGMPGMPAVLNKKAVELAIAAALLTNSEITPVMSFDKKSYFYPDLPTGYQITQWFAPICKNGWVDVCTADGEKTRITLKQIHIEEDAGKLIHDAVSRSTLVDFNRASVPLIEIVSNPDFKSAEEVTAYLEKLRLLLSFAGVSDCRMQEGSMRCDINISVRERGTETLGTRVEIKNMNSLKAIAAAVKYESERQISALHSGDETLRQETRRWDSDAGMTFSMREKETAADYRYFPNAEIMPVVIDSEWIERVRDSMPPSSEAIYERLTTRLGLPEYDSGLIAGSKNLSRIFDETLEGYNSPKEISNWILGDLLGFSKSSGIGEDDISIDCGKFAALIEMVSDKTISRATGKKILIEVLENGVDPKAYVREHKLGMVSDGGMLESAVREVLSENGASVRDYLGGKQKAFGFLVGAVMKKTGGKADPVVVNSLLAKELAAIDS